MLHRSRTKSFDPKIEKKICFDSSRLIFPDRRARCRGTIRFFFNWQRGRHAATLWSTCTRTTSITGRKRKWPSTIKSRTPGSSGPFTTGCRIGCTKVSSFFQNFIIHFNRLRRSMMTRGSKVPELAGRCCLEN